ncbi:MAG: hypothetical protein HGA45_42605 [Chloroflexales bacterium]|nr:hypothetical protein [Chloroflexales bacterium]
MTTQPTIAAHLLTNRSLETLRAVEALAPYFLMVDAGEPVAWAISQALYFDGEQPVMVEFAVALLRERLDVTLEDGEELSELALVELLDPAKGFPPIELRAKAALMLLAMPAASDEDRRNNAYFASYLTDDPSIGLAVSMNDLRAKFGLEPTGW